MEEKKKNDLEWNNEKQSIRNIAAKSMHVLQKHKTIPDLAWNSWHSYLFMQTALI